MGGGDPRIGQHRLYVMEQLGHCRHPDAYIDPPCCNGDGCACNGLSAVVCPNPDCPGVSQAAAIKILRRLDG